MSGDDQPPVTHYSLGREEPGFYAEFLTPLQGSERRRDGSRNVTGRIGGIVAQTLRHLDVLLIAPWAVTVSQDNGFAVPVAAVVLVPNPVSFIVQKLLIHTRGGSTMTGPRTCCAATPIFGNRRLSVVLHLRGPKLTREREEEGKRDRRKVEAMRRRSKADVIVRAYFDPVDVDIREADRLGGVVALPPDLNHPSRDVSRVAGARKEEHPKRAFALPAHAVNPTHTIRVQHRRWPPLGGRAQRASYSRAARRARPTSLSAGSPSRPRGPRR